LAQRRVRRALSDGFERRLRSHRKWWESYWTQSSVAVPNSVIQRQWFLDQYKFGAASRRGAPPITLQGPWTADDGQLPPWKGDYHHDLNTQLSYWPCYSGNHLDQGLSYLDWLWATRSNCVAWTKRFFDLPGLNVPMTSDLNNNQIGGWRQYTHSATTAAWLAHHFYLHWKFSADRDFLRQRAWPYLRDASVFIEAVTAVKDAQGRRTLPLSSSPEIHDNRPQAWFKDITNYDLALMRWLLGATAELADELNLPDQGRRWRRVLAELPELACGEDGRLLVAPGEPLGASHRHFSHLMAIHPLGLIDLADGPAARQTIEAALNELDRLGSDWWCGYSFSWLANLAARAGDGARAERALETFATAFTLRNSFHCNGDQSDKGYSKFRYRPFTLEGNFAAAAAVQEMLLQSQRGRIEVFPAVPASWRDAAFTTLRAQGAFLVSAERRDGLTTRIEIQSARGGSCRLLSPWSGRELVLTFKPSEKRTLTQDPPPRESQPAKVTRVSGRIDD
jgi:alpha-L-fucosidase 2